MLGLLTVGFAGLALAVFLASQLRQPEIASGALTYRCPSCQVPMVPLTAGPSTDPEHVRSYDVLACPTCTNAVTMVHGTRSQCAYCPACHQRALETPCIRLNAATEQGAQVEVREQCHLCGYEAAVVVSGGPPAAPIARGQVIRFPGGRAREKP